MIDFFGCFLPSPKLASPHQFSFELSKHAFCRRIVSTGSNFAHAALQTMALQTLTVGVAGVLTTVVRMQDRTTTLRSPVP